MVIERTRHDKYQYKGVKGVDVAGWLIVERCFTENKSSTGSYC